MRNGIRDGKLRVSKRIHNALQILYKFSKRKIYDSPRVTQSFSRIDRGMHILMVILDVELQTRQLDRLEQSPVPCLNEFARFLKEDVSDWKAEGQAQLVIDFVSGMTDSFFVESLSSLLIPEPTDFPGRVKS